jgi:hypothetical protein
MVGLGGAVQASPASVLPTSPNGSVVCERCISGVVTSGVQLIQFTGDALPVSIAEFKFRSVMGMRA